MSETIKIGYYPGVWDTFHYGQLLVLQNARRHCDYLIVGVCSDELTLKHKGKRPLYTEGERYSIINALQFVDMTYIYSDEDYINHVENVGANTFLCTGDFGNQGVKNHDKLLYWCNQHGVEVVRLNRKGYTSSTEIKKRLLEEYGE